MRIERFLDPPKPLMPPRSGVRFDHPALALGFRPFFLAAGLMAAVWLPLWLGIYLAGLELPLAGDPTMWHAHELVFGFAGAVLAGFLLTAARNWTKQSTASGGVLLVLLGVWLAGRVVMLVGQPLPPGVVLAIDAAFLPLVAVALARPLIAAKNRRNYAFAVLLFVLAAINVLYHTADELFVRQVMSASVMLIVVFLVVMGGRVIPFFTRSACADARVRTHPALDWTAAIATLALVPAQLIDSTIVLHVVALVAGVANLARVAGWDTRRTLKNPLLWVLHMGYTFIGVGLVLLGLTPWVPALVGSAPLHALTVGALGTLALGMMARVSLGHTGRPLVAARTMVAAFVIMGLSALVRVALPIALPDLYVAALTASGLGFTAAFVLFVVVYLPVLTRPRVDGAPG